MTPNMLYLVFSVVLFFEGIRGNVEQGSAKPIKHVREALPSSLLFLLSRRPTHELGFKKIVPVPPIHSIPAIPNAPLPPSIPAVHNAPVPPSIPYSPEAPVIFPNHAFQLRPFNPVARDGQLSYDNHSNGNRKLLNFVRIHPRPQLAVGAFPETPINTEKIPTVPDKTENKVTENSKDIEESKNSNQLDPRDSPFEPVNNIEASPIPVKPKNTELVPSQDTNVDNVLPMETLQGSENSDSSISSADNNDPYPIPVNSDSSISSADNNDPYPIPVKFQIKSGTNKTNDANIANSENGAKHSIEDKEENPLKDLTLNENSSNKKADKPASVTAESEKAKNNVEETDTINGNVLSKNQQSKEEESEKAKDNRGQDKTEKEPTNNESADNSSTEETPSASDTDESEIQSSQEKSRLESTKNKSEATSSDNTQSESCNSTSKEETESSENAESKLSENKENSLVGTEEKKSESESTTDESETTSSDNTKSESSYTSSSEKTQSSKNTENKSSENKENSLAGTKEKTNQEDQ